MQRLSSREAWEVREAPGFFPANIVVWEADLLKGERSTSQMRELLAVHEAAQWDWVREVLLVSAPHEHYAARRLTDFDPPAPLAERLRPRTVAEVVGQSHLLGPGRPLTRVLQSGRLGSLMGAIKIAHRGPQNHRPSRDEIADRYTAAFGTAPF